MNALKNIPMNVIENNRLNFTSKPCTFRIQRQRKIPSSEGMTALITPATNHSG